MLVRLVKLLLPVIGFLCSCVGKVVLLAVGQDRAKKLLYDLLADPDIQRRVQAAGPQAMQSFVEAGSQLRRIDPEGKQWQAFVRDYGLAPQPGEVPEYLAFVQGSRALDDKSMNLPCAGSLVALLIRHPEFAAEWQAEFRKLFDQANGVMALADALRVGWNDFYMVQWYILRTDDIVSELIRRAQLPGQVGGTCTWMLNSVAGQDQGFRDALERVGGTIRPEPQPVDPRLLPDIPGVGPEDWQRAAERMGIALGPMPAAPQTGEQRAAELEASYKVLEGARIRCVMVREDTGITSIVIDTDRGPFSFSSPILAVSGVTPQQPGVPCPTR